jgi:hypothetical protein
MAMRMFWCVLHRAEQKRNGKVRFVEADNSGLHLEMDLDRNDEPWLRAALVTAVRQAGGNETDLSWYRMDVYDSDGDIVTGGYTAPPDGAGYPASRALEEATDDQLLGELRRRLRGR